MLYQDKSLEELRSIVSLYKQVQIDVFGSFDEKDFIARIEAMIEKLKQKRFDSIFMTMNPTTLLMIANNLNKLDSDFQETETKVQEIVQEIQESITKVKESKVSKRKNSR